MKKRYALLMLIAVAAAFGFWFFSRRNTTPLVSPLGSGKPKDKPLLAYTFTNLKRTGFRTSAIILGPEIAEKSDSQKQVFYFNVPEKPGEEPTLKVSGVLNRPKAPGSYPVIVMFRGYIPDESYVPGAGTQRVAEVLAQKGYITLAPDFLGFAQSDKPSADGFEARFQTYTTALTLLASLGNLNAGLDASYSGTVRADTGKVGLWGHSNGGHIALTVLSITGADYPTVLWAPVSKPFPYSILYYTDESDDQGKSLRKASWPFDFFPDVLIVDEDEITFVKKIFFFSGWTETVPISEIRRVFLFKGPFFATVTIEQKSRDKVNIGYLNEGDAFAVKELIDGLLLLRQGLVRMPDDAPLSVKKEILRQAGRNPEAEKEALKKAL